MIDVERHGPWAVIAGGSEGVGAAFATQLAEAGLAARRAGWRPRAGARPERPPAADLDRRTYGEIYVMTRRGRCVAKTRIRVTANSPSRTFMSRDANASQRAVAEIARQDAPSSTSDR